MKPPQRIIVFRIGQIGDTVIALPAFWAVRRQFPQAHLTLLSDAQQSSSLMLARSVLPESGLFDSWLNYPSAGAGASLPALLRLLPVLRQGRYDLLVYLAPRLRSPRQVRRDLLFFRAAGIRRFAGHQGFEPLPARAEGAPLPLLQHEADHLLSRLARAGLPVPPAGAGTMDLALSPAELAAADAWLAERGLLDGRTLVGFCPGSKWASKLWPEERYQELGRRLTRELGIYPILFGGAADQPIAERLLTAWGTGQSAAGALNVRQAAAALKRCALYVGNDTGTMHLAAAVGTPCVTPFSAQDWPGRWYPYGTGHTVLRRAVPCEGCLQPVCPVNGLRCLTEISPDAVFAAIAAKLEPRLCLPAER